MPSWRGAQLKKAEAQLYLYLSPCNQRPVLKNPYQYSKRNDSTEQFKNDGPSATKIHKYL